jgi:hypothetical protein
VHRQRGGICTGSFLVRLSRGRRKMFKKKVAYEPQRDLSIAQLVMEKSIDIERLTVVKNSSSW